MKDIGVSSGRLEIDMPEGSAAVFGLARVLLVLERPALAELIALTLNHGVYTTRAVAIASEVETTLAKWQPHLLVLDMDLDGTQILALLSHRTAAAASMRLPVIGLTRRDDLMAKLAAFEAGVDHILIVPFAPEELLARVIAVLRRSYSHAATFTPVIKIGELETDILKRTVRAGTAELHLTSLEQSLLYVLKANAGRGDRPRGREQRGRPSDPQPTQASPRRLAGAAFHRYGPRPRLPTSYAPSLLAQKAAELPEA